MSWISDNYEKAAIGGAAVVALGCAAIVFSGKGAIDEAVELTPVTPDNTVAVSGQPAMDFTKTSIAAKHGVIQPVIDERKVDLFTGVPLFAQKADVKRPVDLYKSQPLHSGIDNKFWIENELDPGFSDSPERDADGDGFTNREEFLGKTDPNDAEDCPNLVDKLNVVAVKTTQVHVKPSGFGGGKFTFRLQTKREQTINRMAPEPIAPGADIVFKEELMKNRFKFIKFEDKKIAKNGLEQEKRFWTIEDKKPNKKGVTYEVNDKGRPGILDSTIEFTLEALGQEGKSFKVEEKTRFTLPFNAKDNANFYVVKNVDLKGKKLEVEYLDHAGSKATKVLNFK